MILHAKSQKESSISNSGQAGWSHAAASAAAATATPTSIAYGCLVKNIASWMALSLSHGIKAGAGSAGGKRKTAWRQAFRNSWFAQDWFPDALQNVGASWGMALFQPASIVFKNKDLANWTLEDEPALIRGTNPNDPEEKPQCVVHAKADDSYGNKFTKVGVMNITEKTKGLKKVYEMQDFRDSFVFYDEEEKKW
ncbi:hypothetical protein KEM55_000573 [Ascosphaera atra]|nr:hypothetical protein KEM55_000573 [Ascosphaera atra]